jgi:hypothetical protein
LIFWEKEQLAQLSEEYGFSGIHQATAKGLRGFAQFYLTYSKAIEGNLSDREVEEFSRLWLDESLDYKKRILRAALEAEIIATRLLEGQHIYEAMIAHLSLARVVMDVTYENDDKFVTDFIGDKELYGDMINDFAACDIVYNYWQVPDTKAIFTIETEECLAYPNIPHLFTLTSFEDFNYAEHIKSEPSSFQITEKSEMPSLVMLSVLLKDRYFPKMWKQIVECTPLTEQAKNLGT